MKLSTLFLLVLAAAIAVALALANRAPVTFTLVAFPGAGSVAFDLPLYMLVFVSFFLGVLLGGAVTGWRSFRRARKRRLNERGPRP